MLIIQNDPAGITGRRRLPLDCGISLQKNIERHLAHGDGALLRVNGRPVDPLTDPCMDSPPSAGDFVTVTLRPEGLDPVTWGYILAAVLFVASYAMRPNVPGAAAVGKDSPNNSLAGQTNIARPYQAIPDIYGLRRVWPDLIQPSTVEYIDQIKYVTEWLCIGRGRGSISAVKYAETPIVDITGSSYEIFEPVGTGYPENNPTTLTNVIEAFPSADVNGQEVPVAVPFTELTGIASTLDATSTSSTFTLTAVDGAQFDQLRSLVPSGICLVEFDYGAFSFSENCTVTAHAEAAGNVTFTFTSLFTWSTTYVAEPVTVRFLPDATTLTELGPFTLAIEAEQLRWHTIFLRGLVGSVQIKSEWWRIDSDGVEIGGSREFRNDTFTADTYDARYYTTTVVPVAGLGMYRVSFTRITAQLANGADVAKIEELYSLRSYPTKTLPGVTVMRVTSKATSEATGAAERKFNLYWLRHVRGLDSDVLTASRNFGRAMAHVWTLAGNDISGIDTAAILAINEELGEDSPLLRFDCSFDDADSSLGDRLQMIANTARCQVWRDGSRWTVTRDQAKPYPEVQLDYRNLAASGDSTISIASHLPASFDGIEVEYVEETQQLRKAYIRLNITSGTPVDGVGANPQKLKLPGCTTQAQALNRANLEARRLLYQRETVTDRALGDGAAIGLGSLIRWIDPNDFAGDDGLQAGEVVAIDGLLITTSEPVDFKGEEYGRIVFTGTDGRLLGPPLLCAPDGTGAVLLASAPPAGLYVADTDRQLGSRYAFGVGLTDAELESAGLYTVTKIDPQTDGACSLAFARYDPRMYEAD